jgi:hypothetical protein
MRVASVRLRLGGRIVCSIVQFVKIVFALERKSRSFSPHKPCALLGHAPGIAAANRLLWVAAVVIVRALDSCACRGSVARTPLPHRRPGGASVPDTSLRLPTNSLIGRTNKTTLRAPHRGIIIPWSVVQIRPPLPSEFPAETIGCGEFEPALIRLFMSQCVAGNTSQFQRFPGNTGESCNMGATQRKAIRYGNPRAQLDLRGDPRCRLIEYSS